MHVMCTCMYAHNCIKFKNILSGLLLVCSCVCVCVCVSLRARRRVRYKTCGQPYTRLDLNLVTSLNLSSICLGVLHNILGRPYLYNFWSQHGHQPKSEQHLPWSTPNISDQPYYKNQFSGVFFCQGALCIMHGTLHAFQIRCRNPFGKGDFQQTQGWNITQYSAIYAIKMPRIARYANP